MGSPKVIAESMIMYELSPSEEEEVRKILVKDGFFLSENGCVPPAKVDEWFAELRSKGWFPETSVHTSFLASTIDGIRVNGNKKKAITMDDGSYLWSDLMRELTIDGNDFKNRVAVQDHVVKQAGGLECLDSLDNEAEVLY